MKQTKVITAENCSLSAQWTTPGVANCSYSTGSSFNYGTSSNKLNKWKNINSDIVTNSSGVLTFSRDCTVTISYKLSLTATDISYGTSKVGLYCNGTCIAAYSEKSAGSNNKTIGTGGTLTTTLHVPEGSTLYVVFVCDEGNFGTVSNKVSANVSITVIGP